MQKARLRGYLPGRDEGVCSAPCFAGMGVGIPSSAITSLAGFWLVTRTRMWQIPARECAGNRLFPWQGISKTPLTEHRGRCRKSGWRTGILPAAACRSRLLSRGQTAAHPDDPAFRRCRNRAYFGTVRAFQRALDLWFPSNQRHHHGQETSLVADDRRSVMGNLRRTKGGSHFVHFRDVAERWKRFGGDTYPRRGRAGTPFRSLRTRRSTKGWPPGDVAPRPFRRATRTTIHAISGAGEGSYGDRHIWPLEEAVL